MHLSIAPLHDLPPSQRCITTKQQNMHDTAYIVPLTSIVNNGKKNRKTNKHKKYVKRNDYESVAL